MSGDPVVWVIHALRRRLEAAIASGVIAAIDLGEQNTTCLIHRTDHTRFFRALQDRERDPHLAMPIIGASKRPSRGIEQGVIVDHAAAAKTITRVLEDASKQAGVPVSKAVFSLSGGSPRTLWAKGQTEIATRNVDDNAIARVLGACRPEISRRVRRAIHVDVLEFERDGSTGLRDPRGQAAARLGVSIATTTLERAALDGLAQTARLARVGLAGVVCAPVASGLAVTTDDERELGVVAIDMGAGTTGIAAFGGGRHHRLDTVPLGGAALTRDLAEALEIPFLTAEAYKVGKGGGLVAAAPSILGGAGPGEVGSVHVGVVRPRLAELIELVSERLDERSARPIVLTGGGSLLPGMAEFTETILHRRVRTGAPFRTTGGPAALRSPDCAAAHGISSYILHLFSEPWSEAIALTSKPDHRFTGMMDWLRKNW